jgi:hypothetical protein
MLFRTMLLSHTSLLGADKVGSCCFDVVLGRGNTELQYLTFVSFHLAS